MAGHNLGVGSMRVGGIVLCGGRSSRMGRAKARLPVGGEAMLQRVVRAVGEAVDPVVVVAAPGQDVPPLPEAVRVVRDEVEGLGPLAGLAVGLAALEGRCGAAYLSACDVPFLRPAFVRRMVDLLFLPSPLGGEGLGVRGEPTSGANELSAGGRPTPHPAAKRGHPLPQGERVGRSPHDVCVPDVGGYLHPLAAVYRLTVRPAVAEMLAAGRLRPMGLFEAVPTRVVGPPDFADIDPELLSLLNVNTPEEYEAAKSEIERTH